MTKNGVKFPEPNHPWSSEVMLVIGCKSKECQYSNHGKDFDFWQKKVSWIM